MAKKIYFPSNIGEILENFNELDHQKIKNQYKTIYEGRIETIKKEVNDDYKNNDLDQKSHNNLLSCALKPFLKEGFCDYHLLFLEPLYYLKINKRIDEKTPLFDFILAEIIDNNIKRLILGEVKGQRARNVGNLSSLINTYQERECLDYIYNYIEKDTNLNFNKKNIRIEFVLVVQNFYYADYEQSIIDSGLPVNIWEISVDKIRQKYKINPHKYDKLLKLSIPPIKEDNPYKKMLNHLRSKIFIESKFIRFTCATPINLISKFIYDLYVNKYDYEFIDSNLMEIIRQTGGGDFYDDDLMLAIMIRNIKRGFEEINISKRVGTGLFLKRVYNIEDRIIENLIKKKINRRYGMDILNEAIKVVKPRKSKRPRYISLDRFIKNNKEQ